jgi:hypothetical protein
MPMIDGYVADGTFDEKHALAHTGADLAQAARAELAAKARG